MTLVKPVASLDFVGKCAVVLYVKISKHACATFKMPVLRSDGLSYVHCQISILASCVFQAWVHDSDEVASKF